MSLTREESKVHDNRIRAEVLAACMQMTEDWGGTCGPSSKLSVEEFAKKYGSYDCLVHALQNLKPDVADLKALLEEARREAHKEGHGCKSSLQAREGRIQKVYDCGGCEPVGLEKARAILNTDISVKTEK
ncbi:hypothetical protein LCGC14_1424250 [marine sediment metagenome]|uniref:Uncharacterized protein n=1 Tax=marine sediment metagenome TaxID=412755 RepID=A0A0F9MS60_9ZZZZ